MKKKFFSLFFLSYFFFINSIYSSENEIYKKIDLFGEVLEKINEYYKLLKKNDTYELISIMTDLLLKNLAR